MRIIDPQSATLTNPEVLAHLIAHPPRRPPNPPPNITNIKNFVPAPDLRDHNTVVKEIHNYVGRLAPHILNYSGFVHDDNDGEGEERGQGGNGNGNGNADGEVRVEDVDGNGETGLDRALRELIRRLRGFGLTKGEMLMIVNLGVGVWPAQAGGEDTQEQGVEGQEGQEGAANGEGMDVDEANGIETEGDIDVGGQGQGQGQLEAADGEVGEGQGGDEGEIAEEDYGALALLDTVIEEREERLSNEDVAQILGIIRETLGG